MTYNYDPNELERKRVLALESQSPTQYFLLCDTLGVRNPEDEDLYNQGADLLAQEQDLTQQYESYLEQMARDYEPQALPKTSKKTKSPKKKAYDPIQYQKYQRLVKEARSRGINVNDTFSQPETKANLLEQVMGYKKLKVAGGRESTKNCSDSRIGQVFKRCYQSAENYLKQYKP